MVKLLFAKKVLFFQKLSSNLKKSKSGNRLGNDRWCYFINCKGQQRKGIWCKAECGKLIIQNTFYTVIFLSLYLKNGIDGP